MSALVLTGASSFLGRALLAALPAHLFPELRILVHHKPVPEFSAGRRVVRVNGDLLDLKSLRDLIPAGSTVIHLAYLATSTAKEDNLAAARNLLAACRNAGIARLIQCSTAVVVGDVPDDVVTEETPCRPLTDYERVKYRIEQEMREAAAGRHKVAILRPTSVFGPGGRNLVSLARRIRAGSEAVNLAYSLVEGRRRMNLVSVHNVAAALSFLASTRHAIDQQTYIVSDDEDPLNNFRDVEQILRRELGRMRAAPAWSIPPVLLSTILRIRGRSNANPNQVYSDVKLRALGLSKAWAFDRAIAEFARWILAQRGKASGNAGA